MMRRPGACMKINLTIMNSLTIWWCIHMYIQEYRCQQYTMITYACMEKLHTNEHKIDIMYIQYVDIVQ